MAPAQDADARLAAAKALADRARELSLRWFRAAVAVEFKLDDSPVTQADRSVELMLREQLTERFPHDGIVGEEFPGVRPDAEFLWFIDPIDGTKSFISGVPLWGTLIALARAGKPMLGLIDAPATGERWSALRGGAALFERAGSPAEPCSTSRCKQLARARLCLPAPDAFLAEEVEGVSRLSDSVALRRYGGDCYAYGLLASGHLDLIVESGLDDHDFLPMVTIIEAAGGVVSDWSGRPLRPNSAGDVVAAATRALHQEALSKLDAS
jgi:myo-inositol-1(or 4)-monophosphatase